MLLLELIQVYIIWSSAQYIAKRQEKKHLCCAFLWFRLGQLCSIYCTVCIYSSTHIIYILYVEFCCARATYTVCTTIQPPLLILLRVSHTACHRFWNAKQMIGMIMQWECMCYYTFTDSRAVGQNHQWSHSHYKGLASFGQDTVISTSCWH